VSGIDKQEWARRREVEEGRLNDLGKDGWEVAGVMPKMGAANVLTYALLKRQGAV
jgi:hypothetical protein